MRVLGIVERDPVLLGFLKCCFSGLGSDSSLHWLHFRNTINFWDVAPSLAPDASNNNGNLFVSCENTAYDSPWIEFEFTSHLCKITHYRFGGGMDITSKKDDSTVLCNHSLLSWKLDGYDYLAKTWVTIHQGKKHGS